MALGPYKPPAARVEDREPDEAVADRPAQITWACRMLWTALLLGVLSMHPWIRGEWWGPTEADGDNVILVLYGAVALTGVFVTAYAILTYLVSRRSDTARQILLVMLALGWVVTIGDFAETLEQTPWAAAVDGLLVVVELVACYLLFLGPGAPWFKGRA